jgi:hypothetical protein
VRSTAIGLRSSGVGDELALAAAGGVEPVQHGVHGGGEPGDLVVAARYRHPEVQGLFADGGDLGADGLHRAQRAAGDPPGDQGDGEQQQRTADDQGERGGGLGRVGRAQRDPGTDHHLAVGGLGDHAGHLLVQFHAQDLHLPGTDDGDRDVAGEAGEGRATGDVLAGRDYLSRTVDDLDEVGSVVQRYQCLQPPAGRHLGDDHGL